MAEIASAFISIAPSFRGFSSSVSRQTTAASSSAGKSSAGAYAKAFTAAAAVGVGVAAASFLKASVSEAANLEQSVGAIRSVFADSANEILKWSRTASQSVGLSRNEFNELGTLIGSQLKNAGVSMDALAPKTNQLITLGADLSAMYGGEARTAVEALSSALKGERDPIEAYGVTLNQAKIDAEAASLGFEKVGGSLSSQASAAATLSLIYKQTGDAQGTFAKESGTLLGQQQRLGAQFDNLQAKVGKLLLPVVTTFVTALNTKLLPALKGSGDTIANVLGPAVDFLRGTFERLKPTFTAVGDFIKTNPTVVKAFAIALGVLSAAFAVITAETITFAAALNATGIPIIVIALAALAAGLVYAYKHSETFRNIVNQIGAALKQFGVFLIDTVVPAVVSLAKKVATSLGPVIKQLGETFKRDILPTIQKVIAKFIEWQPAIQRAAVAVGRIIAKVVVFAAKVLAVVLPPLIKFAGFMIRNVVPAVLRTIGVVTRIIGIFAKFGATTVSVAGKVVGFAKTMLNAAKGGITSVLKVVTELPGKLIALGGKFLSAGKAIIGKFVEGFSAIGGGAASIGQAVGQAIGNVINSAIDSLNNALEFSIKVGPKTFNINPPDIGHVALAKGGIVTAPTLALVGEGRESEAVLPLSKLNALLGEAKDDGRSSSAAGGGRVALTITNWETGQGYMTAIADGRIRTDRNLSAMKVRAGA